MIMMAQEQTGEFRGSETAAESSRQAQAAELGDSAAGASAAGEAGSGEANPGLAEDKEPGEASSAQETILTLQAELAKVQAQADDYLRQWQRLQAEFDNYRKRTQREKEDIIRYAAEQIIKAMLPVLDNFERAIAASQTNQDFGSFAQGVDMIFRQMFNILAKEGLTPIEAVGQPFDPNLHEAVLRTEAEGQPENTVVEEVQKGYRLKDKVLRPSMVKVSC